MFYQFDQNGPIFYYFLIRNEINLEQTNSKMFNIIFMLLNPYLKLMARGFCYVQC